MPENIIWDVCPASGGQHDSDEAVPMTGAAYEAVREALIRTTSTPVEVQATAVFGALTALPVEQRMKAMGMEQLTETWWTEKKP